MASVELVEVHTRAQLKEFVVFPMRLYADCPQYVPPLIADEMASLRRENNPVYETADAVILLAVRGGETVGRIAGIISHSANHKFATKNARFGWFDCINDPLVAGALFGAVENWARARGMETLTGPQGFNQFGKAGMLTEGFEHLPTMATYYNYPYYNDLVEKLGFVKEVDYFEYLVRNVAEQVFPARLTVTAERVRRRGKYRVMSFETKKQLLQHAERIFDLLQETYEELYAVTPYSASQKAYYIKKFFPYLNERLVKIAVDERGDMVGFFIAIPSMSRALQKARGRLFPLGIYHLWRASRGHTDTVDFCLAGVRKRCRGHGVDVLMGSEMSKSIGAMGFTKAEANPELETNEAVRAEWKPFDHVQHKRRRVYRKSLL